VESQEVQLCRRRTSYTESRRFQVTFRVELDMAVRPSKRYGHRVDHRKTVRAPGALIASTMV